MKETICEKTHRRPTVIMVFGITVLALLMLVSVAATADNGAVAGTDNKVIKDYTPKYTNGVTLHIINGIGSNIVVSWTKANSQKAVFKVNIPAKKTRTVKAPTGNFDQYIRTGGSWYRVIPDPKSAMVKNGHIQLKSGYTYTVKYWASTGNKLVLKKIPDSKAPK